MQMVAYPAAKPSKDQKCDAQFCAVFQTVVQRVCEHTDLGPAYQDDGSHRFVVAPRGTKNVQTVLMENAKILRKFSFRELFGRCFSWWQKVVNAIDAKRVKKHWALPSIPIEDFDGLKLQQKGLHKLWLGNICDGQVDVTPPVEMAQSGISADRPPYVSEVQPVEGCIVAQEGEDRFAAWIMFSDCCWRGALSNSSWLGIVSLSNILIVESSQTMLKCDVRNC